MPRRNNVWASIDWVTVIVYLVLIFMGWLNIYAAVYNQDHHSILDVTQRYGKQLIWIGAALVFALTILLIETNFYIFFSYIIYGIMIFLLIAVLFVGKEINGARSWFAIGGFGFQPSEFTKFATALALARFMSSFGFKIKKFKSIIGIVAIIFTPVLFILLQNDAGSALVYFAFVLVLYREGLSGVVLFLGSLTAVLFVLALVLSNLMLALVLISAAWLFYFVFNPKFKPFLNIALIFIGIFILLLSANLIGGSKFEIAQIILASSVIGGVVVLINSIRKRMKYFIMISLVLIGSVMFTVSVDYAFNNILESHHRARINELLGIQSDPLGAGYNVNQSKIAIGSGGFWGKGYLKGTQTKFDFVPEQSTDFIFCTVGEEWGFVGTLVVISLFLFLFIRLIWLAERQRSGFSRIYGYSVAVILFFHFMVNIGMTIGLMPVIGIPLPFFSYGGSSLWSFTILLFIFIRLDASRLDHLSG